MVVKWVSSQSWSTKGEKTWIHSQHNSLELAWADEFEALLSTAFFYRIFSTCCQWLKITMQREGCEYPNDTAGLALIMALIELSSALSQRGLSHPPNRPPAGGHYTSILNSDREGPYRREEGVLRLRGGPAVGWRSKPKTSVFQWCAYNEYLLCMLSQDTQNTQKKNQKKSL